MSPCFAFYAIGILDFYHAAQNLWKGVRAWLDGRSKKARQWFASARHRLRHGETNEMLNDIAAALELERGIQMSVWGVYYWLKKVKASHKIPRKIHAKQDKTQMSQMRRSHSRRT